MNLQTIRFSIGATMDRLVSLRNGQLAWRWKVPRDSPTRGDDKLNNVLEFLTPPVGILLLVVENQEEALKFPCLMALGENTSAIR